MPSRRAEGESPAGGSRRGGTAARRTRLERERRAAVLRDIAERVSRDGEHVARAHPDRARQFMPFAALKGYGELVRSQERTEKPCPTMTDERAAELSAAVAQLAKGDAVRLARCDRGRVVEEAGTVEEVDATLRTLRVSGRTISFDDLVSLEPAR